MAASCQQLAIGVADVQDMNVDSPEQLVERMEGWSGRLPPEQTLKTGSCGMNHLPRHIALARLRAMSGAKAILTGRRSDKRAPHSRLARYPLAFGRRGRRCGSTFAHTRSGGIRVADWTTEKQKPSLRLNVASASQSSNWLSIQTAFP